jgi:hypothetical protein
MAKNLCTPQRVFGSFEQHLFLGCSVRSFTSNIGWNEQVSDLDVELAEDTCATTGSNYKVFYDEELLRRTTTSADPGFTYPIIGSPAYFRVADFEFCGLVQSYEQTNNEGGNPTFKVKLVDPRIILEGTQVIIGDYAGSVYGTPNVLNAYGFAESYGQKCPLVTILGAQFGSPAGAFGGSAVNHNGMAWNKIKEAVSLLTSSIPAVAGQFNQYGRLVYRGSDNPGYGSMKSDLIDVTLPLTFPNQTAYQALYFVDLSEVPNAPELYRLAGTSISLLEAISTVCEDGGCDYYVELVPVKLGSLTLKVIKIRIAVRGSQPSLGSIAQFVEDAGNVISKTVGRELRNEATSQFIIGGQVESIYQAIDSSLIQPYWGRRANGDLIQTGYDADGNIYFDVDITSLNTLLYNPLNINIARISEYELQGALTGQDAWLSIATSIPSSLGLALNLVGVLDAERIAGVLNRLPFTHHLIAAGALGGPRGGGAIDADDLRAESESMKDIETVYNFVLNYARDYYGKKFMVRIPYTCARIDDESQQTFTSESPSDAGWTEHPTVIGLDNPDLMDIFKEGSGKIGPFVKFTSARDEIEISSVNEEDYILIDAEDEDGNDASMLYLKASLAEQDFVYENFAKRYNPHVVIDLAVPILEKLEEDDLHRTKVLAQKFFTNVAATCAALGVPGCPGAALIPEDEMTEKLSRVGNSLLNLGFFSKFKRPEAAAVAIRNNVLTYGPWVAKGPPGQSKVERDDGLVPWEYGSVDDMDEAGEEKVNQGVTYMQVSELGSLTIPGYPALQLGAELRSGGASVYENRTITTNKFSSTGEQQTYRGKWNASTGSPPSSSPNDGDYWVVSVAGTTNLDGTASWSVDELAVYAGGKWQSQVKPNNAYISRIEGAWTGSFGPNITGITCDVGDNGVTTSYSMRTYTPKFGRFSKRNSDQLKEYAQFINGIQKQARLAALSELKVQTNRGRAQSRIMSNRLGNPLSAFAPSPPGVLIGQVVENEDGFKSTAVFVMKHNELTTEVYEGYDEKAFMSLDGILRPVSRYGSGGLSPYASYSRGCLTNVPDRPEPPLNSDFVVYKNLAIHQQHLDPWAGPDDFKYADSLTDHDGHDIDILGRGTTLPNNLSIPVDEELGGGYTEDYRGFALKGPLLLQQPGFDLQGKPVPNANDTEANAEAGFFRSSLLADKFLPGYMRKPSTWPVAPVDLRYDRKRGVWVAPQPYRNVKVELLETLTVEGSEALVIDGNSIEDANGVPKDKQIKVFPISEKQIAAEGDIVLAEYDVAECKYRVIEAPAAASPLRVGVCLYDAFMAGSSARYITMSVAELTSVDGEPTGQVHDVKMLKFNAKFHNADVIAGDIIAYSSLTTAAGDTEYIAVSDYSRDHTVFMAYSESNSLPDNGFRDFNATVSSFTDGSSSSVSVKNRLKQPIKENVCCLIYRRFGNNISSNSHYYLLQAMFTKVCVVTKISITTSGGSIYYPTSFSPLPGGGGGSSDDPHAWTRTGTLNFHIEDINLYTEAAYQKLTPNDGGTSWYTELDVDVRYRCCSQYTTGLLEAEVDTYLYSDFHPLFVQNSCEASDEPVWEQDSGGGCTA